MSRNDYGTAILGGRIGDRYVRWKDTYSGKEKRAGE